MLPELKRRFSDEQLRVFARGGPNVGGMFPKVTTYVYPPGQGQWYDPFSAAGRETYWKQIRNELFAKGVDGWWLDAPEPESGVVPG